MSNSALIFLQQHIGQSLTKSPSPLARWLNGTLIAAEEGTLTVDFLVREEMTNPVSILHGGTIAAMMDEVIGTTVYSLGLESFYASVNLHVDFLESTKVGETVRLTTQVVRKGNTLVNVEAQLFSTENKLLAKGTSNLVKTGFGK